MPIMTVSAKDSAGDCPTTNGVANFNVDAYLGRWYEHRRDMSTPFEWFGECGTATYTLKSNGKVDVKNRAWFWWWFFSYYTVEAEATCPASGKIANCEVQFGPEKKKDDDYQPNYKVLATDYYNYSVVYSCNKNGWGGKTEYMWILTRDSQPSASDKDKYKSIAKTAVPTYDHEHVIYPRHDSSCDYDPK